MDTRDLTTFETVARLGGMGRAARELNTVQSNVTQRVRRLEERWASRCSSAAAPAPRLTAAGDRLMPNAVRVGALFEEAGRAARDDGAPQGALTVGALETTAAFGCPPCWRATPRPIRESISALRTGTTAEMVERVLSRELEGAFVCGPVAHPNSWRRRSSRRSWPC